MKVKGVLVPDEAIDAAVAAMKRQVGFQSYNVERAIRDHIAAAGGSISAQVLLRAADRVIQRERKAGNIGPLNSDGKRSSYWRWIGGK